MKRRQLLGRRRLRMALVIVVGVFGLFALRLFQIQGFDTSAYAAMAQEAGLRTVPELAERGRILDRSGAELAGSIDASTLIADPKLTSPNAPQIAQVLKEKLGDKVDYFDLITKLRTPNSRFVYLVKSVPAWQAREALDALDAASESLPDGQNLAGVFTERQKIRTYPGGTLAANLMGFTNAKGDGVGGLEQQYDDILRGKDGMRTYSVSPKGQRIPLADTTSVPMVPGDDITTTIDRDLQWYADQRLTDAVRASSADWGLAITMDVRTCEVVQLSQAPTFNADVRKGMTSFNTVSRALQTVYEPGSVMKPVTFAALADQGKIAPDSPIVVPPSVVVDGFRISDYWDHGTIHMTAAGVIAQSSNMGTVVASRKMSDQTMYDYFRKFGFGEPTGVGLPGESRGIIRKPETWTESTHATMSFGQGVSVTGLQMLRAINTIANDGMMCDPRVVKSVTDSEGHKKEIGGFESHRVVSTDAARAVTRMMETVTQKGATAPAAAIEGYRVAGKTGTAWRVNPDTGRYVQGQTTVSFIGFAPADEPRFITYVVLDKTGGNAGGGVTAGPVFHDIMSMALERFGITPTGSKAAPLPLDW